MLGAERAHIDGLHTSEAAVVFDLHAGEILKRVGYAGCRKRLQLFTGEALNGSYGAAACRYLNIAQGDGVGRFIGMGKHHLRRQRTANRQYI